MKSGIRVFYDQNSTTETWGKDLYEYLNQVYSMDSEYTIILFSANYSQKFWATHEFRSALEKVSEGRKDYILPVMLDECLMEGYMSTIGFLEWDQHGTNGVTKVFNGKIGKLKSDILESSSPAIQTQNNAKLRSLSEITEISPSLSSHLDASLLTLPDQNEKPFWRLVSFPLEGSSISIDKLKKVFVEEFVQLGGMYSYSTGVRVQLEGYSRDYVIASSEVASANFSCYSTGAVVSEGYFERYYKEQNYLHPIWFSYMIQRHIQLSKWIYSGIIDRFELFVLLRNLNDVKYGIMDSPDTIHFRDYGGYHKDISREFLLSEILDGADRNKVILGIKDIIGLIVRIFGADDFQPFWNSKDQLVYADGIPDR